GGGGGARGGARRAPRGALGDARAEAPWANGALALRRALNRVRVEVRKAGDGKPLWARLGGEKAVRAVVRELLKRGAADPKVNFTRGGKFPLDAKALAILEQRLVALVSSIGGGPLKYTRKDLKTTPAAQAITAAASP